MQPPDDFDPPIGVPEPIAPGVRRLVAPNPSPMTYRGTNTYLVGDREIAVIDPGPDLPAHLDAILTAVGKGARVTHIIVTHAHVDHSPLSRALSDRTGAPIYGFGPAQAGRSAIMETLAATGVVGGGEGIDTAFAPDVVVDDGDHISGEGWTFEVLHTPGHIGNHISLAMGDLCITGDHVMGWASSLVSPPDGDLTDFMASCRKLAARDWSLFCPGHGAVIDAPSARLDWLIAHRMGREAEIRAALTHGPANAAALARMIYKDTPTALLPAAERNVLAHLIDLYQRDIVETKAIKADAEFALVPA